MTLIKVKVGKLCVQVVFWINKVVNVKICHEIHGERIDCSEIKVRRT